MTDEAKVTNSLDSQQASSIDNDTFANFTPTALNTDVLLAVLSVGASPECEKRLIVSSVSVLPSVCQHETTRLQVDGFL